MNSLLGPEEFAHEWGPEALIRLPDKKSKVPMPADTRDFLVRAGLPALITYYGGVTESKVTFYRLDLGPSPLLEEETVDPRIPASWSAYVVVGDEFFCNGCASWCIHQDTGHVLRVDPELQEPVEFVNSSVAHFASAALTAVSWSQHCTRTAAEWVAEVDRLTQLLGLLDPESTRSTKQFWGSYLDFIRSEGPAKAACNKGTRHEAHQAWIAGPW
jgi:hypothetical protein